MHAAAHEGCTDTVRESALKADWEKHPLPRWGIEPASATCRASALPTESYPCPPLVTNRLPKCPWKEKENYAKRRHFCNWYCRSNTRIHTHTHYTYQIHTSTYLPVYRQEITCLKDTHQCVWKTQKTSTMEDTDKHQHVWKTQKASTTEDTLALTCLEGTDKHEPVQKTQTSTIPSGRHRQAPTFLADTSTNLSRRNKQGLSSLKDTDKNPPVWKTQTSTNLSGRHKHQPF